MSKLIVSSSPHQHDNASVRTIMLTVLISLLPAAVASVVLFGIDALILIAVCIISSIGFEYICRRLMKREQTIGDLSAAVTGLLLALNLPSTLPVWQAVIGSFVAIAIVKQMFGGLGQNFANPAITARIILMMSFTTSMTTWTAPFDGQTTATPLAAEWLNGDMPFTYKELLLGTTGGSLGETCALALIMGGILLIACRIISPAIPVAFIGTTALLTFISGGDALYQILSGGLLLGAFFMATDYATSPITTKGELIFGIGCGVITFLIRQFGGYPEGVSFSILLMNILTPYIDNLTLTKPLGAKKEAVKNA